LIEEIEGMGKSGRRELENRLAVLLRAHSQMVVLARSKKLQLGGYNQRITARSTPFTKLAYGCVCPNLAKRLILEEFISSRTNTHACKHFPSHLWASRMRMEGDIRYWVYPD
jgi:hypothetical protein